MTIMEVKRTIHDLIYATKNSSNFIDKKLIQLEVYKDHDKYGKPSWITHHDIEEGVKIPDHFRGFTTFVWKDENNEIICKKGEYIEEYIQHYYVSMPYQILEELDNEA